MRSRSRLLTVLVSTRAAWMPNLSPSSRCHCSANAGEQSTARRRAALRKQLSGDHPSLDRLADADVVGNEQPHDVLAQCYEQWYVLVAARCDADAGQRPERAGRPVTRLAARCAAGRWTRHRQDRRPVGVGTSRLRRPRRGRRRRCRLRCRQWLQRQEVGAAAGLDYPFAPASTDETADGEVRWGDGAHAVVFPGRTARRGARPVWASRRRGGCGSRSSRGLRVGCRRLVAHFLDGVVVVRPSTRTQPGCRAAGTPDQGGRPPSTVRWASSGSR